MEDRLDWNGLKDRDIEGLHGVLGSLLGWAQLRSGGRDGSSIADASIAFGSDPQWRAPLLEYATGAAERFARNWQTLRDSNLGK